MKDVLFYVKAGRETGYGHVVRCVTLADELKKRGLHCIFVTDDGGADYVLGRGYSCSIYGNNDECDMAIVDLEGGCPLDLAGRLRPLCKTLVILNGVGYPDGDPGRLMADLVFYQGRTQRPHVELDWTGFGGQWYEGSQWLILRPEFSMFWVKGTKDKPRVVVCGGGSDPKGVTQRALDGLGGFRVRAIVGPAALSFPQYNIINHTLVVTPQNMAETLAWADVAVISYGMTAFECLALGLPTVALSISEDHAKSAELVQDESGGALRHLGLVEKVRPVDIERAVRKQLEHRDELSFLARQYVDGRGCQRVTDRIMEAIK